GEIRIRQRLPNTLGSFLTGFIVASYLYLQSVSEAEPRTVPGKPAKGFGRIVVHDIAAIDIGMEEVDIQVHLPPVVGRIVAGKFHAHGFLGEQILGYCPGVTFFIYGSDAVYLIGSTAVIDAGK